MRPTPITSNEKPATATIRDRLNFVFSTTNPLNKEQTNVSYHIHRSPFKQRL